MRGLHLQIASVALLLGFSVTRPVCAQVNFGRISGSVADASEAVVPGVQLRVINEGTGVERTVVSNDNGTYLATNLPVGTYSVKVNHPGFQPVTRSGLNLVADGRLTVDVSLSPAGTAQAVDVVEAVGEAVNTVSGELSRVVNAEQVQDLALNGRNYLQLATLIPGSALLDEDQLGLTTSLATNQQSVNGNRGNSNSLSVDGSYNVDSGSNASQVNNVGVDFIREVNIKTSNFSAEYGRNSGAAINVITRGGGNQLHGGALEFLRNDSLDARNFFAPQKGKLRFNDFGWNLGGPIIRNKLFFFGGEEWKKIRQDAAPLQASLPTRKERQGNFSERSGNLNQPGTSTPVPNRNVSGMITADGRAIAKVFERMEQAASSYTDTPTGNNAVYQYSSPFDWREDMLRLDYVASSRHSLYGRYIHDYYNLIDPFPVSGLPTVPINRVRPCTSYQLTHTWTISSNLINEARGAASWTRQRRNTATDTWMRETYGFAFPQIFNGGPLENGIPQTSISGFTGFSGPVFIILSPVTDISFTDNFTWIKGSHTIKTGVLAVRNRKNQNGRTNHAGNVSFSSSGNPQTTGNAFADALLGNYRTYSESNDDPVGFFRFTQADGYIQDNWKVSRRLSLEFGMRYQHGTPLYTAANNVANFDPSRYDPSRAVSVTSAGLLVPGVGNPYNGLVRAGSGVPANEVARVPGATSAAAQSVPAGAPRGLYSGKSLLAPRFSFAFAPRDSKTSIRGGFGMFFDRADGNIFFPTLNNPPYLQTVQLENGNLSNPAQGKPVAQAPFGTVNAIDGNLDTPYSMNFSFSIQRELPRGFLLEAAYVGNGGRHLLRAPDINQASFEDLISNASLPSAQRASVNALRPFKGYSTITMRISDSTSNYNALQLYVNKRKGNLQLTGSYTWSKTLTDASGEGDNPENFTDRHFSYGPASFDRRHILVGTYTYHIPFARHWKSPARIVFAGWDLSGVNRLQTGQYYTATGSTSTGTRRADYLGGPVSLDGEARSMAQYFNTAAFAPAPDTRRGNSGVGLVRGPSMFLWDLSMRKEFAATERLKIRFKADLFNLPNHANFRGLNLNVSNRDFGSIGSAGPARNIQLGVKAQF